MFFILYSIKHQMLQNTVICKSLSSVQKQVNLTSFPYYLLKPKIKNIFNFSSPSCIRDCIALKQHEDCNLRAP